LHEIYNWFTTTFAYFRRNAASWKVKTNFFSSLENNFSFLNNTAQFAEHAKEQSKNFLYVVKLNL
jgi:hypothetical protein